MIKAPPKRDSWGEDEVPPHASFQPPPEAPPGVPDPLALSGPRLGSRERARRLRALVDEHWEFVGRVLRNLGVAEGELDDGVQQVFLVADAKLELIRAGSERAFLAQTGVNIAARHRRAVGRSREVATDEVDTRDPAASPEEALDRKRALGWLDLVLSEMSLDLRSVFVLYEVEEMTMAEIASALGIPAGTVASRLRRAREEFHARAESLRTPRSGVGERHD